MSKPFSVASMLLFLALLAHAPARAGKPMFRWERMTVSQVAPSSVYARLGLTHNTRHGYTRDGFKKTDPDPDFPPGLTDVVPMDREHVLLVRGTDVGLAQFRARVAMTAEQMATEKWHLTLQLLTKEGGTPLGPAIEQDLPDDRPTALALGETTGLHIYSFVVHVKADGSLTVTCRSGLPLPTPSGAAGVLAPTLVWTEVVSKATPPGGTVVFEDPALARQVLRRKVGLAPEIAGTDYQVRVTVAAPPGSAFVMPQAVPQTPPPPEEPKARP